MKKNKTSNMTVAVLCAVAIIGVNSAVFAQVANNETNFIGEAAAEAIALAHAGLNANEVEYKITRLDNNRNANRAEYDVEFWSGNTEYDYEINATTGDIISYDYDAEYNYRGTRQAQSSGSTEYIGAEQAKSIALAHAGTTASKASRLQCSFDYDDRFAEYEVEWKSGWTEYEYTINAITGDIMGFDVDKGFF